ncbi:unnamed protein product [Phaedon cochleariae]|uniref:Serpin domain-containing protein n=1 Tax=Phaedon cochleariae TaxID=80249 RepID=A0A9P0GS78_PHACE|nr:unnamed protein product [Phaedon cochleariae]
MNLLVAAFLLVVHTLPPTSTESLLEGLVPEENFKKHGLALEAVFSMGLRLQAIMDTSSKGNFVVSPLSTTAIISQLLMGADGEFESQLYDLLSLPKQVSLYKVTYRTKKYNETQVMPHANFHLQLSSLVKELRKRKDGELFTLNLDNALFYNEDIELRSFFKRSLEIIYDSDIRPLNFYKDNTASIINKWAEQHTNGLIKTVLQNPLPISTASMFVNSIYFQAEWETPFSDLINIVDNFHTDENDTVEATYMTGHISRILYAETKDYRVTCLPYQNRELGMYIIFPTRENEHKYDINKFLEQLKPQELIQSIVNAKLKDVVLRIPKLSLSNTLSILKPLQKYTEFKKSEQARHHSDNAIDDVLDKVSSYKNFTTPHQRDILLTRAARGENLRVSDIVQQMVFSINEKGTEAAAVSLGITDYMGGSKTVVLNRPFAFFIRHEATLATLFWGSISDPSKN